MDLIEKAMIDGVHLNNDANLQNQTWCEFESQKKRKKLFLFGTGKGMEYFLDYCSNHMKIDGVLDNDTNKHGMGLGWYCAEAWHTEYEELLIQSPDVLSDYDKNDIIVLVTVVRNYDGILAQLMEMGIDNCFVLLMLEANRRQGGKTEDYKDLKDSKEQYIKDCCQQPVRNKKIVMRIGEYGGHARYITKQLLKIEKDLDIVWIVFGPNVNEPQGVRLILERNWKSLIYELETAKIWLFDVQVPDYIVKRPKQIYIQTKHWSSITLKKFGIEDKTFCSSSEIEKIIQKDGSRTDYLFSGSELDENSCRNGWAFKGEAIRIGSPRSDILFDKSIRERIRIEFGLKKDTHILLYAPTFRKKDLENNQSMTIKLDMISALKSMSDRFGGVWVLFVRLHPIISFEKSGLCEQKNIINAGNYADGGALVAAADAMITDYSSIMFEAAYINQPVFLYAPDYKEFIEQERDFLLDYHTLPFPMAKSNEGLRQCIMDFDKQKYEEHVKNFLLKYGVREDGHASERAADFIMELVNKK